MNLPRFVRSLSWALLALTSLTFLFAAAPETKRRFNLPAGDAAVTLARFAEQADREIIFSPAAVRGVLTNAVTGEFVPRQALDLLVARTGLVVTQDPATSALAVRKGAADPNGAGAAQTPGGADRPAAAAPTAAARGTIVGRVANPVSGEYVKRAQVRVEGTTIETYTDADGAFQLINVPAGLVTVRVSFAGLGPRSAGVTVEAGRTVVQNFELDGLRLRPAATGEIVTLPEFTVEARELNAQSAALQEQRTAASLKNVVAFEEFGDLGEGNVGEFLKFVPGIQIAQEPDVANTIKIRTMPNFGAVFMVDGVMSANDGPAARGPSFTATNTANIDRVEITKMPTPDMPANAIGGALNIISKSGFSRSRPQLNYDVFGTLTTLDTFHHFGHDLVQNSGPDTKTHKPHTQPNFDVTYIHPVSKTVAVAVSAGYNSRVLNMEYLVPTWNRVTGIQTQSVLNAVAQLREREILATRIDWKPAPHHSFFLTGQYATNDNYSRQSQLGTSYGSGATGGEFYTQGGANGSAYQALSYISRLQFAGVGSLGYKYDQGPWKGDCTFGYSRGQRKTLSAEQGFFGTVRGTYSNLRMRAEGLDGIYDRKAPIITATNSAGETVNPYDARGYTLGALTAPEDLALNNSITSLNLNFSRDLPLRVPLRLATGLSWMRDERDLRSATRSWTFSAPASAGGTLARNYDVFNYDYSEASTFKNGARPLFLDAWKLYRLWQAHPEYFTFDEAAYYRSRVSGSQQLAESISAAYLRADLKLLNNRLWLVGGGRVERTDDRGEGPMDDVGAIYQQDANGKLILNSAGRPILKPEAATTLGQYKLRYQERGSSMARHYAGFYPSFNAAYTLTEDFVFRAAYARTIARPGVGHLFPGVAIADPTTADDANRTITANNSGLKAWTANNYDLTFEAYTAKGATLSVSGYRKDVSHIVVATRTPATPELLAYYGLNDNYLDYDIITEKNATYLVKLSGLELSWRQSLKPFQSLPPWLRSFSVYGNVSYYRVEGEGQEDFTGYSPRVINWGVAYTTARFLGKVNVNQTLRTRVPVSAVSASTPAQSYDCVDFRLMVDVSFEYRFAKRLAFYGSARNLSGDAKHNITYSPNAPAYTRPRSYQYYGTLLSFGIKGTY